MKKIYKLRNLDCANCAAKMEAAIAKMPEVETVSISFMTQKMTLTVSEEINLAELMVKIKKAIRRVEPDCEVVD